LIFIVGKMRKKYRDEAERVSLGTLLKINREFPKVYCSTGTIERRLPKGPYGTVVSTDISDLLKKYIAMGLVLNIDTMESNGEIYKRYRINFKEISKIEKLLK